MLISRIVVESCTMNWVSVEFIKFLLGLILKYNVIRVLTAKVSAKDLI